MGARQYHSHFHERRLDRVTVGKHTGSPSQIDFRLLHCNNLAEY